MLDKIFNGINLGSGVVGQSGLTGAGVLRTDSRFNSNLANGNYQAVASTLNTLSYTAAQNPCGRPSSALALTHPRRLCIVAARFLLPTTLISFEEAL
ncbi:MAG: hypothetical protein DMG14_22565 [Acidobacteria bacterium]|nr:MAG: hypothetical protein DMG14_22565 [Acidobacteriota bacterium]